MPQVNEFSWISVSIMMIVLFLVAYGVLFMSVNGFGGVSLSKPKFFKFSFKLIF